MIRNLVQGVCASLLLAGCISTGTSPLADDQAMAQIKVGETTKQQVANLLGEPASRRAIEMGGASREWWAYSYQHSSVNPLDYIFLYGLLLNGIGTPDTRYDLSVFFDHRGVVSSLSRTKADYDMGRPFSSMQVSSAASRTTGFQPPTQRTVQFEERMEYRY